MAVVEAQVLEDDSTGLSVAVLEEHGAAVGVNAASASRAVELDAVQTVRKIWMKIRYQPNGRDWIPVEVLRPAPPLNSSILRRSWPDCC